MVYEEYKADSSDQPNRVYQDDVTATYAYKTAQALNLKPTIMGYGATGITCAGQGAVPRVREGYPFYYHNAPIENNKADYIVINHRTNDGRATAEEYILEMEEFLKLVRKMNLYVLFLNLTKKYKDSVLVIDSKGWLPKLPVHPGRDGHMVAVEKLIEILNVWVS